MDDLEYGSIGVRLVASDSEINLLVYLFEDHQDQQFTLLIRLASVGFNLDGEGVQSVVSAKCIISAKFDEAMVALKIDQEGFQILDVWLRQLGAQPIYQLFHTRLRPMEHIPHIPVGKSGRIIGA